MTAQPRLAVSCAVLREDTVLLVRRGKAPAKGRWAFPGGSVEPGERMASAVRREVREETGLMIDTPRFLVHHEVIEPGFHYVIVVHRAEAPDGEPTAADDAAEARFVPFSELEALDVTETTLETIASLRME